MRFLERTGVSILRMISAYSFVDAVCLFNSGNVKSGIYFMIAAVMLWLATKDGVLIGGADR